MSTTTEPLTTKREPGPWDGCIATVVLIGLAAPFLWLFLLAAKSEQSSPVKYLTLAVESTAVRYYNVTPDGGRVFSIIGVGIRAGNPDPDGPPLNLTGFSLSVEKHMFAIADGDLPGVFNLTAGSEEVVHVEAFGLVPWITPHGRSFLSPEFVEEVRADLAAGEGIVDVKLRGGRLGELWMDATCENVVIDCSGRSAVRAQKVDCKLRGYPNK